MKYKNSTFLPPSLFLEVKSGENNVFKYNLSCTNNHKVKCRSARSLTILILFFIFSIPTSADNSKLSIAVLDFKAISIEADKAQVASELLRTELVKLDRFQVLERSEISEILKELKLQESGCTDASCALQVGRMLTASKIVIGTLTKLDNKIILNIRLVDVEKSTVDYAGKYIVEKESDLIEGCTSLAIAMTEKIYGIELPEGDRLLGKTKTKKNLIRKGEISGMVISVKDKDAVLDIGKNNGVRLRQQYEVIEYFEAKKTNNKKDKKEKTVEMKKIGKVTIKAIEANICKGRLRTKEDPENIIGKEVVFLGYGRTIGYKAGLSIATSMDPDIFYSAYLRYETERFLFRLSACSEEMKRFIFEIYKNDSYDHEDDIYYSFNNMTLMVAYKITNFLHIGAGFGIGLMKPMSDRLVYLIDAIPPLQGDNLQTTQIIDLGITIPVFGPPTSFAYLEGGFRVQCGNPYILAYYYYEETNSEWHEDLGIQSNKLRTYIYGSVGMGF